MNKRKAIAMIMANVFLTVLIFLENSIKKCIEAIVIINMARIDYY